MADLWKPRKINLVERPEWSQYDTAGTLGEVIFQNMAEGISFLGSDDIALYALQVLNHGRKKRTYIYNEGEDAIFEAFAKGDPALEGFRYIVNDAASWAWEIAFTPTKEDVEKALDDAIETFAYEAVDWLSSYDGLWASLEYMKKTSQVFMRELLQNYIRYYQEEGHYDRYIIFDPNSTYIAKIFHNVLIPPQGGVLDWEPRPDFPNDELGSEVKNLLKEIEEPFIERTFRLLKKDMQGMDPGNRYDFRKSLARLMKDDPKRVRAGRKELVDLLKKAKEQSEEEETESEENG